MNVLHNTVIPFNSNLQKQFSNQKIQNITNENHSFSFSQILWDSSFPEMAGDSKKLTGFLCRFLLQNFQYKQCEEDCGALQDKDSIQWPALFYQPCLSVSQSNTIVCYHCGLTVVQYCTVLHCTGVRS